MLILLQLCFLRYLKLRDDHNNLKLSFNLKIEEVKRTNVQLLKIENLLKTKEKMDAQGKLAKN